VKRGNKRRERGEEGEEREKEGRGGACSTNEKLVLAPLVTLMVLYHGHVH